jgi:hypothetical protein
MLGRKSSMQAFFERNPFSWRSDRFAVLDVPKAQKQAVGWASAHLVPKWWAEAHPTKSGMMV